MSRDFTPCDMYMADKQFDGNIRNVNYVQIVDGKRIPIPKNEILKTQFPETYFLFESGLKKLSEHENFCEVATNVEEILVSLEKELETGNIDEHCINANEDFLNASIEDVTKSWFFGKLDPDFYYRERNNDLFLEYLETIL